jgi:hypothetical protein
LLSPSAEVAHDAQGASQGPVVTVEMSAHFRGIVQFGGPHGDGPQRLPGQPKRADVILAGACIVRTVMAKLEQTSLTVSDRGLRHGVLADRFDTAPD